MIMSLTVYVLQDCGWTMARLVLDHTKFIKVSLYVVLGSNLPQVLINKPLYISFIVFMICNVHLEFILSLG